ncbi:MAG: hypothetical protein EXR98_04550 [Gemmataceae bacterium]|nr:hypothetical protein [Gemmataceae bacterium]
MKTSIGPSTEQREPAPRAGLWHRLRPPEGDSHTSILFWLTVLLLGGVALGAMTWGASSVLAQKGSEKLLRVDLLLPKLKSNHGARKADAFRTSEPESSEGAHPKERKTLEPAPLPRRVFDQPKITIVEAPAPLAVEAPRVAIPGPGLLSIHPVASPEMTCSDPVIYLHPCTPQRGDSPMMRNWKTLTMYSLLSAAAVTFAPPAIIFAQENKEPEKKSPAIDAAALLEGLKAEIKNLEGPLADLGLKLKGVGDDVKDIKDGVAKLKLDVSSLQTNQLNHKIEIDKQKKEIEQLAAEVRGLRSKILTEAGPSAADKAFADELLKTLKSIQDGIAKLHAADTSKRIAMSPPNGSATTSGRVMLQNFYTEELLFVINNVGYRVSAGKSRLVENVPLGTMQYLVHSDRWGPLQNRSTTLSAAENTFTVTASSPR